jgi:hypothetical protein
MEQTDQDLDIEYTPGIVQEVLTTIRQMSPVRLFFIEKQMTLQKESGKSAKSRPRVSFLTLRRCEGNINFNIIPVVVFCQSDKWKVNDMDADSLSFFLIFLLTL